MISDLATNLVTSTTSPAADASQHTPAHHAGAQPLRVWSTPRLHRLDKNGTNSGVITGLFESSADQYIPHPS